MVETVVLEAESYVKPTLLSEVHDATFCLSPSDMSKTLTRMFATPPGDGGGYPVTEVNSGTVHEMLPEDSKVPAL